MPATVVTFSIQAGSDGYSVARAVAAQLNYQYHDWQITARAAAQAEADGGRAGLAAGIMERLTAAAILEDEVPAGMLSPSPSQIAGALRALSSEAYRTHIEEVVRQVAARGSAVIVGHGSQAVLGRTPDVLKVLVVGSEQRRASRIAVDQSMPPEQAFALMRELDGMRRDFFRIAYEFDWQDPTLYDLTLNTDVLSTEAAFKAVTAAVANQAVLPSIGRQAPHYLRLLPRAG